MKYLKSIQIAWAAVSVALVSSCIILYSTREKAIDPGITLVKLMYEFSTPTELLENQAILKELLVDSEWLRLQLDNELRVVNAYYKFKYSPSKVNVLDSSEGYVLYSLENDYIDAGDVWVLLYDYDYESKLFTDIVEYKLEDTMKGGFQD